MRRCSSASFASGTERNCVSAAVSAAALRKPKIVADAGDAGAFPLDELDAPKSNIAEARSAAERSFIRSEVKVSKVAQVLAAVVSCDLAEDYICLLFAKCTNFTIFTIWCSLMIYLVL
jgi:hypothetical protein